MMIWNNYNNEVIQKIFTLLYDSYNKTLQEEFLSSHLKIPSARTCLEGEMVRSTQLNL